MTKKWVYVFAEGSRDMKNLLGGKGSGLAEMTKAGLPVPPGFTATTEACLAYFDAGKDFPEGMWKQALDAMKVVEEQTGKKFGDPDNPLLVSVRSGARVSMPGMMDTILNLGLNRETLHGLAEATGNERFAYDSYRRLIQLFGRIVKEMEGEGFEAILNKYKERTEGKRDTDLTVEMLKGVAKEFKELYLKEVGEEFPEDPYEQLRQAVASVFDSWFGKRAVDYRNFERIPHDWGTAVNVQTMVFGNMGDDSGTGVAFTRRPDTGEAELYGEYLTNAQGEDVVAGIRTPVGIAELQEIMPEIYDQFVQVAEMLENNYRDMQDMEFTVERGKLWMLQTRTGKRTAQSAITIAVDMVAEGAISKEEALMRVSPEQVAQLLHPFFDPDDQEKAREDGRYLAKGLNASPGAGTGMAALDADTAEEWAKEGKDVILVRPETSPDDVHGMLPARGILTQRGGATSHAAVVARSLGKPCVAGCEAIRVDTMSKTITVDNRVIQEGDIISVDGTTGEVFSGTISTVEPNFLEQKDLLTLLSWADEVRRLGVWANADYPRDAILARQHGADGIGLCRTEHMFFEDERRPIVVRMIMASAEARPVERKRDALKAEIEKAVKDGDADLAEELRAKREKIKDSPGRVAYFEALNSLLPFQQEDFEGIFEAMDGLTVIIRLIDPPMHEFLPPLEELLEEVTELRCTGSNPEELAEKETMLQTVQNMWEVNPMLGLRGCRAGLMYPGLTEMQVRAIFEAACRKTKEGIDVRPEVMIPLVGHVEELRRELEKLERVAKEVIAEHGVDLNYKFGTMIELPRAALTANEIAEYAQFFSFGTNDLTQMTYGISRDDAEGKFLLQFVEDKILPFNPFQQLDRDGVGKLMEMAVTLGRGVRPGLEIGICGEHGGDPSSIEFCHMIGLNYVSCSPYRVPVARLAAAQSALQYPSK
ncbi:MAG: pyruvate, phosphate dikinase [Anaerolineae bacterium]|nr:pyruvate, phosphate dikinase [Anaerolineae bacterium]